MVKVTGLILTVLVWAGTLEPFCLDLQGSFPSKEVPEHYTNLPLGKFFTVLKSPPLSSEVINFDQRDLHQAVRDSLDYIERHSKLRRSLIAPKKFSNEILSLGKVVETLRFMDQVAREDLETGRARLQDPAFLAEHFGFIRWRPDQETAIKNKARQTDAKSILLTGYVIYEIEGSPVKTKKFCYPLYQQVDDSEPIRLTKQDILKGALERGPYAAMVKPLVWVTRAGLEDALMQGTVFVTEPNGNARAFKVHFNNGHKFDKKVAKEKQKLYWFFKELGSENEIKALQARCRRRAGVFFAGDIHHIGLGKVIAIKYTNQKTKQPELRLGVLGDAGGAFTRNLYQLDLFGGIVRSRFETKLFLESFPDLVRAYVLYKK